jgi:hypothetical protein
MRFRKKPVVIDAVQLKKGMELAPWLRDAVARGEVTISGLSNITRDQPWAKISTLEGDMRADAGDWIIRGVKGELYSCKPDVFEMTYEAVE